MKKTLLIFLGVTILLCVIGIWVYLLVFGAPKNSGEVFSNFGFSDSNNQIVVDAPTTVDTAPTTTEGKPQALKQLTSRPVAGAVFIDGGIRYMERGTGYVYDILLATGNENQVSVTTLPHTTSAIFSKDGSWVVVTTESGNVVRSSVGSLGTDAEGRGALTIKDMPISAHEISFVDSSRIAYIETTPGGSGGVRYDLVAGTSSVLFTIPLRDIRVLWGRETYVYTTPTASQVGYLYRVGKDLEYVTQSGLGLMGISFGNGLVVSKITNTVIESTALSSTSAFTIPISLLPEKCVAHPTLQYLLYCSAPASLLSDTYPDNWYKGTESLQDILWMVDTQNTQISALSNFLGESGREIDVATIGTNADGTLIYFINKNDGSLWMFDTTI